MRIVCVRVSLCLSPPHPVCSLPPVTARLRAVVGKRKFDGGISGGGHQNQGDPKRRYASAMMGNGGGGGSGGGGGGGSWGSQPLPQQPLGTNGSEQWYTDTYAGWS